MGRAELRRAIKNEKKAKTDVYKRQVFKHWSVDTLATVDFGKYGF